MGVSRALDRLPRMTIDVGPRRLPAFRSMGILGVQVALLTAVVATLVNGAAVVTVMGASAAAMLTFFVWGIIRRALTGAESLVLMEYVWVASGVVALYLWAVGWDMRVLDSFMVGLAVFLAFGRLGCLTVGCCHGYRSRWGITYGPDHIHLSARLRSGPLFPVQAVEMVALVVIAGVGLVAAAGTPGLATVWFLVSYAIVRFGTEALRGDPRPRMLGLSVPRTMAAIQFLVALALAQVLLTPAPPRALWIAGAVLLVGLVSGLALVRRRGTNPLVEPAHLDETWDLIQTLGGRASVEEPVSDLTSQEMAMAVSSRGSALHASMSHAQRDVRGVAVALVPEWEHTAHGVTHAIVPYQGPPSHRPQDSDAAPAPPDPMGAEVAAGVPPGRSPSAAAVAPLADEPPSGDGPPKAHPNGYFAPVTAAPE